MTASSPPVGSSSGSVPERRLLQRLVESPATAVASIWICSGLLAVLTPDMITGSEQEHLPIAAITVWVWTATATVYVLMAAGGTPSTTLVLGVTVVWASVLLAAVASPLMVTGTDPTQIPLAALLAPPVGAITTGFLALHHAMTSPRAR